MESDPWIEKADELGPYRVALTGRFHTLSDLLDSSLLGWSLCAWCYVWSAAAGRRAQPVKFASEVISFSSPKKIHLGKETSTGVGSLQNLHGLGRPFAPEKQLGWGSLLKGSVQDSTEPVWVRVGLDCCLEKAQQKQQFSPHESLTAGSSTMDCHCHRNPPALALGVNSTQWQGGFCLFAA